LFLDFIAITIALVQKDGVRGVQVGMRSTYIEKARKYGEVVVAIRDAAQSLRKATVSIFLRTAQALSENLIALSCSPVAPGLARYDATAGSKQAAPTKLKKSLCRPKSF
jgi:hypothetical protein